VLTDISFEQNLEPREFEMGPRFRLKL